MKRATENGFVVESAHTYIARLGSTPDEIEAGFSKSTRKRLRRAMRNELIVESTTDIIFINAYYSQLCEVFEKSNMRPTYPKQRVEALWQTLMPTGRLIATWVLYEGQPIATRLDFGAGIWMHSFGSASRREFLGLYPNELARYRAMCAGVEKGFKYYDMSGGGTYKAQFGAEKVTANKLIYDPYGLNYAKRIARRLARSRFKLKR